MLSLSVGAYNYMNLALLNALLIFVLPSLVMLNAVCHMVLIRPLSLRHTARLGYHSVDHEWLLLRKWIG
jgi:hypothetical protein